MTVIWSPGLYREISQIEKVRKRFTKRLRGLRNVGYTERLNRLGLPTLELRRLQLDLIFCYKIGFGLTSLTSCGYFHFSSNTNTRGHAYKLYISQKSCNIRRKILSCRILTVWNSFPGHIFHCWRLLDEHCIQLILRSKLIYIVITTKRYCN